MILISGKRWTPVEGIAGTTVIGLNKTFWDDLQQILLTVKKIFGRLDKIKSTKQFFKDIYQATQLSSFFIWGISKQKEGSFLFWLCGQTAHCVQPEAIVDKVVVVFSCGLDNVDTFPFPFLFDLLAGGAWVGLIFSWLLFWRFLFPFFAMFVLCLCFVWSPTNFKHWEVASQVENNRCTIEMLWN